MVAPLLAPSCGRGPDLAVAPAVLGGHVRGRALGGGSPVLGPAAVVAPGVALVATG